MKEFKLKKLTLNNFKGVKSRILDCETHTSVYGVNGTGKTTINDAYRWLITDKDSRDRGEFGIKTLDSDNKVIHGLEHSVTGLFHIIQDGAETLPIELKKVYTETWRKKRGTIKSTLTGHETQHLIDNEPVTKAVYNAELEKIVPLNTFKMLMNPFYFADTLKWEKRRAVLFQMANHADSNEFFDNADKQKAKIKYKIKNLNSSIEGIPPRIDEINNTMVEIAPLDNLEAKRSEIESQIKQIDKEMLGLADPIKKQLEEINGYREDVKELKDDLNAVRAKKVEEVETLIRETVRAIKRNKEEIEENEKTRELNIGRSERLDKELASLRAEFQAINESEPFSYDKATSCPVCKREFDPNVIEEDMNRMKLEYNQQKANRKEEINDRGASLLEEKDSYLSSINNFDSKINQIKNTIEEKELVLNRLHEKLAAIPTTDYSSNKEITELDAKIEELNEEIKLALDSNSAEKKAEKKAELNELLKSVYVEITKINASIAGKLRIDELMDEEKELSQAVANQEKSLFKLETEIKTKIYEVSKEINDLFKVVDFKLFSVQINGSVIPECNATINGVPFNNANNGGRIKAGIDIINTLSNFFGVTVPIVIDNYESITDVLDTEAQTIKLIVSKEYKNLLIETDK